MTNYLKVAIDAAKEAGCYIAGAANKIDQLEITQKSLNDYVSEVDRHSESLIINMLTKHFPKHAVLGEEYGQQGNVNSDYQWVIDPLDGTTNFLRSIPHYAVSIAMLNKGELQIGVVYDPIKKDLFYAEIGKGSYLNGDVITVSSRGSMNGALLATGIPFSGSNLAEISSFTASMEGLLSMKTSGIRRLGAAALDLAYVACGRYDGFWESNLKPWDVAAGVLLVSEAGGSVSELNGGIEYLSSGNILASNTAVHEAMLGITTCCYKD